MVEPISGLLFWEKTKEGKQATRAPVWIKFLLDLRYIKTLTVISLILHSDAPFVRRKVRRLAWDSNRFLEKLDARSGQRTGHIEQHGS